jgi:hypothetical protein
LICKSFYLSTATFLFRCPSDDESHGRAYT